MDHFATADVEHHPLVIVGAGFAGMGLVIKLREAGFTDLLVLERGDGVGGTWRSNSYPGCACDVPSQLYSFSFEPNPDWSRAYSKRDEILAYAQNMAVKHDLLRDIRFGCEVLRAEWDEEGGRWHLETNLGSITATVLISALGPFGEPIKPDFPGLDTFEGTTMHSYEWDHEHDLTGERVAVVGTGASAVQMIPVIARRAAALTVFQRTACWIMPRLDHQTSLTERRMLRAVPVLRYALRAIEYGLYETYGSFNFIDRRFVHLFEAISKAHMRMQLRDPELRAKLTPNYRLGCKRAAVSSDYLPTFTRPNVELVTDAITEVTPHAVVTADGTEREVDTIVLGTGFTLMRALTDKLTGRDGSSVGDVYRQRPQSYYGVSIAGFPNLFLTSGPFGGAGNQSFLYMLESQFGYIVDALKAMRAKGWDVVDVKAQAQSEFVDDAERRSEDTIWLKGGCTSYYTTPDNARNSGLWPDWSFNYRRKTKRFVAADYTTTTRSAALTGGQP